MVIESGATDYSALEKHLSCPPRERCQLLRMAAASATGAGLSADPAHPAADALHRVTPAASAVGAT